MAPDAPHQLVAGIDGHEMAFEPIRLLVEEKRLDIRTQAVEDSVKACWVSSHKT